MNVSRSEIEAVVLAELRTLVPHGTTINLADSLIEDLELLSDDATSMALCAERRLGVRVERSRWATDRTVQDAIDALDEALRNPAPVTQSASLWERLTSRWR